MNNLAGKKNEWHETKCKKCSKRLIRYITERHLDPYYHESKCVIINRDKFKIEMLQPGQVGFKTHYADSQKEIDNTSEKKHIKEILERDGRDAYLKKYGYKGSGNRETVLKAFELEDKMTHA
jgi:hypothetical protein